MIENAKVYLWMIFVGFIGGLLRIKEKTKLTNCKGVKEKIVCFTFGIISSIFVAYIIFEIAFYYFKSDNLAVALAGVGAWMSTDGLIALEQSLLEGIRTKFTRR